MTQAAQIVSAASRARSASPPPARVPSEGCVSEGPCPGLASAISVRELQSEWRPNGFRAAHSYDSESKVRRRPLSSVAGSADNSPEQSAGAFLASDGG